MLNRVLVPAHDLLESIPRNEFHIHTTYSDGINTIQEYVLEAAEKQFKTICFVDHVDFSTTWFEHYRNTIFNIRKKYKFLSINCGIEVRIKNHRGDLNTDPKILNRSEIIMGVVHRVHLENERKTFDPKISPAKKLLRQEYKLIIKLLKNPLIDILGHPMANYEKHFGEVPQSLYLKILETAKKQHIAVELNPGYQQNFPKFLKLTLEVNPLISLGSNVHSVSEFGKTVERIKELI